MFNKYKLIVLLIFTLVNLNLNVFAAPAKSPDASTKAAMAKLQAMVKEATSARDMLKAENDKIIAELEQVKKEKESAISESNQLQTQLEGQKSTNSAVSDKLDQTHAKLLEVIEKYNALNKSKNELSVLNINTENKLKLTENNLISCENKNLKLFEAGKEILSSYENKNLLDSVLKEEPIFKFKSVEMEGVIQEYEDKLHKEKYLHKEIVDNIHNETINK